MKQSKLFFQIFPYYLGVALLLFWGVVTYTFDQVERQLFLEESAELRAFASEYLSKEKIDLSSSSFNTRQFVKHKASDFNALITLLSPDGRIVADSDAEVNQLLALRRPALKPSTSTENSYQIFDEQLFVQVPIINDGKAQAYLLLGRPLTPQLENLAYLKYTIFWKWAIVIFGLMLLMTWVTSKALKRSLELLLAGVDRFSKGDFKEKIPLPDPLEITLLAKALNDMADKLNTRIQTISNERNERNAMFSSMIEGVLSVDNQGKILSINRAASKLFGCDKDRVVGQYLQETLRHVQLVDFVSKSLKSHETMEGEIEVRNPEPSVINVHATPLKSNGQEVGTVVVLHDITALKKLEVMRQEFVANVSHELRTPITLIQGFIETLEDGAIHDPETAMKFVKIIKTHSLRLNDIIEDLLSLSRLEQENASQLDTQVQLLQPIVEEAVSGSKKLAELKNIVVSLESSEPLTVNINGRLILQALVNLLDNAVKYSPENKTVCVKLYAQDSIVNIDVIDQGVGISPEHLSKLFGRFYRVDKARSRQFGGTGLGLAIVKHIAKVHHGDVQVESVLGKGSVFRIQLPLHKEEEDDHVSLDSKRT